MLYARFNYPDNGHSHDGPDAIRDGLVVGERYEVSAVDMSGYHTDIYLNGFRGSFNSVMFDFENEDGTEHNIYKDPECNPYIRG